MDSHIIEIIVAVVTAVAASSGFWAFIQSRADKNDNTRKLLIGIAHDRIMWLGQQYINRGTITADEYENLMTYLYEPYAACGGNGSAKHVVDKVDQLEISSS